MEETDPQIEESWKKRLLPYFRNEHFKNLRKFLIEEKKTNKVFPPGKQIFNAFNLTPFEKVKVVIIGQDPYHGDGQAHGLSFSVRDGVKIPPSLQNIFKELKNDVGITQPLNGNLQAWAKQGVLLLNASLTVRASSPGSHQGKGWEQFTDGVIKELSEHRDNLVFLLWGKFAESKAHLINTDKHRVFSATHPSPFSAHRGFFGCAHFSKTNTFLKSIGKDEIDWQVE